MRHIKRIAKKIFKPDSQIAKNQIDHISEQENAWNSLFKDTNLICVDVGGANDLQPHWNKIRSRANFVIYEPDSRSYEELIKRKDAENPARNNFHYIKEALSRSGGPKDFFLYNVPTGSTFYEFKNDPDIGEINHPGNSYIYPITKIKLETVNIAESLDNASVKRIDMIKLDVQGAELEILQGLDETRWKSLLCCEAEVNFRDVYVGASTFESVKTEMVNRGFKLFDLRISRYFSTTSAITERILQQYFKTEHPIPSIAGKIWEADHIYMRDDNWALNNLSDIADVKKLVIVYCVYNFFFDAILLCEKWKDKYPHHGDQLDEIIQKVVGLQNCERNQLQHMEEFLKSNNYSNWGQYMWVPYPST